MPYIGVVLVQPGRTVRVQFTDTSHPLVIMIGFRARIGVWLFASLLGCGGPACAGDGIDWPSRANRIVSTVAKTRDLQTPAAALTFAQDRAGFLWAGGESGLFRWDGYQFRFYTAAGSPHDGLLNHYVFALHTDRAGRLWVGTESGGLARYDEATDRFQPVALADSGGEAVCVWSLDDDGAGGLWVGTNRGVAHLDSGGLIVPLAGASGSTAQHSFALPNRKVEAVLRHEGTLWIGGSDGLAKIGPDGRAIPVTLPVADGLPPQVSHLMLDSAGRIWVGTRHHGAYVVDPISLRAVAVALPATLAVPDGKLEIMAIEEVEPGTIWLATFGKGIIEVDAARLAVRSIVRDPRVPGTLDSDLIYGLFKDRSGITWISTAAALDQFVPPPGGLLTLFGNPAGHYGLPQDITAIIARPDGSVWLASQNNGIVILGADGKVLRTIAIARVSCLAAEAEGPVYIGTRSGLFVADPTGERVEKIEIAQRRPNAGISSLAVIDGVVWVGGFDDDGLWELHPTANGLWTMARHFATPALPSATIHEVKLTQHGLLVVGTADGIGLLDRATGDVEPIVHDPADPGSIMSGQIVSSLTDQHGRLWVGSDGAGIDVMLGRNTAGRPIFRHIILADGLPDSDINRMIADVSGRVWVSTDNGLAEIDPDTFAVNAYKDADGVAISTYWNDSGDRTPQGDLLFGGIGGLTVVRPNAMGSWVYRPRVAVSEIHVGGKLVRDRSRELVVAPDANSLAVDFAALDFSAPNRNLYRYRLDGFDTDYMNADAQHRLAVYTNLPPGSYTLRLEGTNRNGVWGEPARLAIRVRPAWFQTIVFRVCEVAAVLLLGGVVMQARTIWLRRRQVYLEDLVQERTAELLSKTKDLVASQQTLKELAYLDALTSLPNRRLFNETLHDLVKASAAGIEFVLILIDLDGFKQVNDTLGHDAGDDLLVIAAGRLRTALRAGDFVSRLGGDEFAILLTQITEAALVSQVCDRVVAGMMAPLEIRGQSVKIGASVGVALSPEHGQTAEDLYKHADQALYQAKRSGKGVWRLYADTPLEAA